MFVGHTRFSLFQPGSTAWVSTRGETGDEAYKAYLYSRERMQPRAQVFFDHLLPLIDKASQGHTVRHIVSYSPEMPEEYKHRMRHEAEYYPWLILDEYKDGKGSYNANRVAREVMRGQGNPTGVYGTYRVDDDDLIPVDYFDRMATHMNEATVGMYVSLGKGVTAIFHEGRFANPRVVVHPKISVGLLGICRMKADGWDIPEPYKAHIKADEAAPVILDSRSPGFVWTRSTQQDTALLGGVSSDPVDALNRELNRLPAADLGELDRLFPEVFATAKQ